MTTQTPSSTASSRSTGTGPVLRQTQFLSHEQSRSDTMPPPNPGLGDEADHRAMGDNSGGGAGGLARAKSAAQQSALLRQQQYQKQRHAQFVEEEGSRGESSGRLGSRQRNSMGSPTTSHTSGISSSPGAAADFDNRGTTLESAPLLLPQNSQTSRSGFGSSSAEDHRSLRSTISMEHLRRPKLSSSPMSSSPSNAPLANPPIQIPPPLKPRPVLDENPHGGITFMRVADPPQPTMAPGSDRGRIWEQGALRALMDNVDETDSRPSEIIPGPDDLKEEDSLEGSRRPINSWKPWNAKDDGATTTPAMTSSSSTSSSRDASPRGHRRASGMAGSFIATPTMATFPEEQEPLSGFASASTSPPLTGSLSEPLASPSLTPTAERIGHGTLSNGSGTTAQASHGASSTKARSGTLASVGSMATLVAGGAGNSNSTLIMHDAPRDRRSEHVHIEEGSGPVVLMAIGKTGQGKSSLLNKIMGTSELKASASVRAVTKGIAERTGWGKFEMSRRVLVTLADTPGLADTEGDDEKNIPILKDYISSIGARLGVTAFLLVFKIDAGVEMIMTILTTFNEIMQEHPNFWENVILVFTGCDFKRNVMSTKELYHRVIQEELSKLFLNRIYLNDQGQGEEGGETHSSRDGGLHSRTTSTTMGLDTELSEEPSSIAGHDDDVPSSSSMVPQIPMVFLSTAEAPCGFALGEKCDYETLYALGDSPRMLMFV
ncbi:hypothetical protein BGW38_002101 [Lunasporangiospora selenospora]|uniref:AIG1-type G domain-containing protein n=1 Tax=Lunasporangiospora selenospora TaxID=979761 RepID=A0A9P6KDP0_9FUNG|nr:hypothetical protein BGW38_002101 [Lunasporangiospora selenospora]